MTSAILVPYNFSRLGRPSQTKQSLYRSMNLEVALAKQRGGGEGQWLSQGKSMWKDRRQAGMAHSPIQNEVQRTCRFGLRESRVGRDKVREIRGTGSCRPWDSFKESMLHQEQGGPPKGFKLQSLGRIRGKSSTTGMYSTTQFTRPSKTPSP